MNIARPLVLTLVVGSFVSLASCSSSFRSDGKSSDAASSSTGDLTSAGGTGTMTASSAGGIGAGGGTGTGFGGPSTTDTSTETTSTGGGMGGVTTTDTATSTTGGIGGTGSLVMHCEASSADCVCDGSGCFLTQGAGCTQATDCKTQVCGVTQDASNICCAQACGQDQVCLPDGSGCETADACEDTLERCSADGNHEECQDGQWVEVQDCSGRGCSLELTQGCLHDLGGACQNDSECGLGTCQETTEGGSACCDASCGECQVCNPEGSGCGDPADVKPGCDCTDDDLSNCNDNKSCTTDTCNDGRCDNELQAGYCLIDEQCIDHNQAEPGNPCRYCDSGVRDRAWTNSANTVSCNDNAWCNGTDTCNGSGSCQHQFPTDRCTESGPCALDSCDESRDSCYEPSGASCKTEDEWQCESSACGGDVQKRTITTRCSGASAACDGDEDDPSFADSTNCSDTQTCNASSHSCQTTLGCGDSWCDNTTGLCWTLDEPSTMPLAEANAYCAGLTAGGRGPGNWRLPTIQEWLRLSKGCDDATGTVHDETFQSTCVYDPSGDTFTPCEGNCPADGGPAGGCYWPSAMGLTCWSQGYWSTTVGTGTLFFSPNQVWVVSLSDFASQAIRCVTVK